MSYFSQLRSLLFVPGDDERKLARALQAPADAVVFDWEDGVAAEKKALARSRTTAFLSNPNPIHSVALIRLNPVHDRQFALDLAEAGHIRADGFLLSKVESLDDVCEAQELIGKSSYQKDPWLFAMIESAAGLLRAPAIATCKSVAALLFGAEDFCSDTGITFRKDEFELLYARSALVTAAASAKCQAIDSPVLAFNDDQALQAAALRARDLGFSGKLAIHPRQVEVINSAFSASREEIEKAKRVVEIFEANGEGVAVIEGVMVDEAVVKRARRVLELAKIRSGR